MRSTWLFSFVLLAVLGTTIIPAFVSDLRPVSFVAHAATGAVGLPRGFVDKPIATGLSTPTSFAFLPDGRVLIAEKSGTVRVLENGTILPSPLIDIGAQVNDYYERGLLGIAVDPDFSTNGHVYLLYTYENDATDYAGPKTSRLSRFTVEGASAPLESEEVILGSSNGAGCAVFPMGTDCLPAEGQSHSVGAVEFASDRTLFVTTGDAAPYTSANEAALRAQDLDSLAGKLIHITRAGEGLPANPFYDDDVDSNRSKIWAYGLRNGFRFDLRDGLLPYVGDVGWGSWEEIDVVHPGVNLGWPCFEGDAPQSKYQAFAACQALYDEDDVDDEAVVAPLTQYAHGDGAAIVGGAFYEGTTYPKEYRGAFFFGDFIRSTLSFLKVDEGDTLIQDSMTFASDADGPVDIDTGPHGDIFYLTITDGELHRIRYSTVALPQFSSPVVHPSDTNPHSVVVSDINADGDLDLVAGNATGQSVGFYPGDGSGAFGSPTYLPVPGRVKYALPVDVNADDEIDLVTANESTHSVSVLIGEGDFSFAPPITYGACTSPHEVKAGDLNSDGRPDLVVPCTSGSVSVLLSTGSDGYAPFANYAAGAAPHSVAVQDLDEDEDYDVAVANRSSNNLSILIGDGTGTLQAPVNLDTAPAPHEVRTADLNSDGHLDLVTANDGSDTVSVLIAEPDGGFAPAVSYPVGNAPMSVVAVDLDGDGVKDLATANSAGYPNPIASTSIGLSLGNGDGTFEPATQLEAGPHPFSIAAGDLDSDEWADLVIANFNVGSNLSVYLNRSSMAEAETPGSGSGGGGGGGPEPDQSPSSTPTPTPEASVSPPPETAPIIVEHPRSVILRFIRTDGGSFVAAGRVVAKDGTKLCVSHVRVKVKRNGEVVARTATDERGAFRTKVHSEQGSYVGVIRRFRAQDSSIDVCLGARSARRHHPRT
jgi:glucose/arabinose dehydrogenase